MILVYPKHFFKKNQYLQNQNLNYDFSR
jgi:hypothetical protein